MRGLYNYLGAVPKAGREEGAEELHKGIDRRTRGIWTMQDLATVSHRLTVRVDWRKESTAVHRTDWGPGRTRENQRDVDHARHSLLLAIN
jgi:hypothetical protein